MLSAMASAEQASVNDVARRVSDKLAFAASSRDGATVDGPNHIDLPLNRDKGKLAFTLEGVFRPDECQQLIDAAESVGFGVAGIGSTGSQGVHTGLRDSGRLISADPLLAEELERRMHPYLPAIWQGRRLVGLNEQLKFLRYRPGQRFVAHVDGNFRRHATPNQTFLTVQLYLSPSCIEGGATNFCGSHGAGKGVRCLPEQGRVLVFQHNILHEGEEVRAGVKYTIRTDAEYGGWTWSAQMQELLGLGCSPRELRRRMALGVASSLALWAAYRFAGALGSI
mmetsp:Transcript_36378/g.104580  ORF Transcript_36378/g.104580 Transcript_36378/m.104580 type:complete len:281 (+) Transcript_36378:75-917(+)